MNIQEHKKAFVKALEDIDRSKNRQENFISFCEMAYCAIAKTTALTEAAANKFEDRYMEIVEQYRNKDDVRKIPELLTITTLAINEGGCDFLGEVAAELEALDKKNGQFFTPYHLSKLMAGINLSGADLIINEQGFITISDPAAGAGCMILASADYLEEQGHDITTTMSAHATELSRMTYHMLFVQLSLRGIPAAVIHGNSISLEVFESAYTPAARVFANKHGSLFKETVREELSIETPNIEFNVEPIINAQQLNLFG